MELVALVGFALVTGLTLFVMTVWLGRRAAVTFAFCLPVLHMVGDIAKGVTPTEVFHAGNVGVMLHVGYVFLFGLRLRLNALTLATVAFVTYLALLIPLSSMPMNSLGAYLKVFAGFMLLPIASRVFNNLQDLRKLQVALLLTMALAVGHFTFAQLFQFGRTIYSDDHIFLAGGSVFITYVMAYVLTGVPLTLAILPKRLGLTRVLIGVVAVYSMIVMFVVFRRGALLGIGGAAVAYFILTSAKQRRQMVLYLAGVAIVGAATAPFYLQKMTTVLGVRGDIIGFISNTERGRMSEFGKSVEMFQEGSLKHRLFGTDLFSSKELLGVNRALHVDFTNLFVTSGLVGLLLYATVIITALLVFLRRARRIRDHRSRRMLTATFVGLMIVFLGLSASRQLGSITSMTIGFLYMGALLGIAKDPTLILGPDSAPAVPGYRGRVPLPRHRVPSRYEPSSGYA